jgi:hypothetical protein
MSAAAAAESRAARAAARIAANRWACEVRTTLLGFISLGRSWDGKRIEEIFDRSAVIMRR